jgi:ectoine hydroxylase-related dioxygenase (phytanoyl-CoA dioxygenase family)
MIAGPSMASAPTLPTKASDLSPLQQLEQDGYCILGDMASDDVIAQIDADFDPIFVRTPFCTGGFYGERTKRFGRLLLRSGNIAALVQCQTILDIAQAVLGPFCDQIQLNLAQAIEIHPGAPAQFPHRDQDMWAAEKGQTEYLLNVMWPLTPFVRENGATIIWPHSHQAAALDPEPPKNDPVIAETKPGSAILFLGSTLHGAGANITQSARRAVIISYSLGWLKPYENQWLAYPPDIARHFPAELAALVGYRQHRPNLGNFEGQCPSILLGDALPDAIGAVDALRPDQQAMLEDYLEAQRRSAGDRG